MCAARPTHPSTQASFAERADNAQHPLNNYLLRLMSLKRSNLCLSADVTSARELLSLANKIGPSIVVLKTHYDLVTGWDYNPQTGTGAKLAALARKHGFLIFEDRKFGDIGNTVQLQYTGGTARIIDWAHIVNVNMVPGKAAVQALAEAAAKWRSRLNYGVKTSVSVGTPLADMFDDDDDENDESNNSNNSKGNDNNENGEGGSRGSRSERQRVSAVEEQHGWSSSDGGPYQDRNGRKGSIVSVNLTQSFEPVDSPRFANGIPEGDEMLFAGIEEPPHERGLLILAQMSSEGNFMDARYTAACAEAAREHRGFVMGFIAQETLNTEPGDDFLTMTPGCQLPPRGEPEDGRVAGDGKGQQYNTPAKLVGQAGSDIVIVGRGILKADDPQTEAERYRKRAWQAYLERTEQQEE